MYKLGIAVLIGALTAAGCATAAGGPVPSQTAVATSAATIGAAPVETGAPTPRPTAQPVATTLEEPIPDELIGAWYHPSGAYWWLIRAGAPMCVTVAHTALDCVAYKLAGQPAFVGAATMVGRVLHIDWTRGYCAGDHTLFGTGVVGNTLKLFDTPDDCGGDDFVLSRAGSGTTPSAPPPPTN
jgi:hypothetical protein